MGELTEARKELTITRVFDAPRERVWRAWTDPELFKRWWGPEYFTSPIAEMDLRVGPPARSRSLRRKRAYALCYTTPMTNPNDTPTARTEAALARFREGFNCSQSSFVPFAEDLGLPADTALRLASPFGGGIGRRGEVCGAATGALLALGLRYGSATPDGKRREGAYAIATEFLRRFEARTGAIHCRDLIDADMTTHAGLADARERKVFKELCPGFVAAAVEIAQQMLEEEELPAGG